MPGKKKPSKIKKEIPAEETLEKIVEQSRVSAEAYRKILASLEARLKHSKNL